MPYRIVVFATGKIGNRKKSQGYAYIGWTADQTAEPHRLPGSGTFLFAGLHRARRAALEYLALPETDQVSIRTNQDREVFRFYKGHNNGHSDR